MGPIDDCRRLESAFVVRMLKYGTYEVVLQSDAEAPPKHISDFRSKDEAQAWIKENAPGWHKLPPPR